jgi:hypothetical protein
VTGAPSKSEKVLTALEAIGGQGTAAEISQATQEQFGPQHHVPEASVSYFLVREDTVDVDKDGPDAAIFHLNGHGEEDDLDLPPIPQDLEGAVVPGSHTATVLRAAIDVDERGSTIATSAIRERCADEWPEASEDLLETRTSTCINSLHERGFLEDAGRGNWRVRTPDELDENDGVEEDARDDRGADQEEADDVEQLDQTTDVDIDENLDEAEHNDVEEDVRDDRGADQEEPDDVDEDQHQDVDADDPSPPPRQMQMSSILTDRELELLEDAMKTRIGSDYADRDRAKRDAWLWVRARQLRLRGPP